MTALTKREQEVYKAIVNNIEGLSTSELAEKLKIKETTFRTYLLILYQKRLAIQEKTQLIILEEI